MEEKKNTFTIVNDEGKELECDVLFTFDSDETKKSYGLYLYRAIYNFGIMSLTEAVSWFSSAIMIIVALPLGLIFARIITDRTFRYCT